MEISLPAEKSVNKKTLFQHHVLRQEYCKTQWNVAYKLTQKIYKSNKILCTCQYLFLLPWFDLIQKPMKIQHNTSDRICSPEMQTWMETSKEKDELALHGYPFGITKMASTDCIFWSLLWSHSNEETHCTHLGATIRFYSGKLIYFMRCHWLKR